MLVKKNIQRAQLQSLGNRSFEKNKGFYTCHKIIQGQKDKNTQTWIFRKTETSGTKCLGRMKKRKRKEDGNQGEGSETFSLEMEIRFSCWTEVGNSTVTLARVMWNNFDGASLIWVS